MSIDSEAKKILDKRLMNGEISEEQYQSALKLIIEKEDADTNQSGVSTTECDRNLGHSQAEKVFTNKKKHYVIAVICFVVAGVLLISGFINNPTRIDRSNDDYKAEISKKLESESVEDSRDSEPVKLNSEPITEKSSKQAWQPFTNSIGMKLVWVPSGEFMMGTDKICGNVKPIHKVKLSKGFGMGQYEVTQSQYKEIMGNNPSYSNGSNHPVEKVSWYDAMSFCKRLSKKENRRYSLPTEAQWEYSCLAGGSTKYSFGNSESQLCDYAWYDENSGYVTHPVGQKAPNPWNLYDLHGNVKEWCLDWYGSYSSDAQTDPEGPASGECRVQRGGSCTRTAGACRSYDRSSYPPDSTGFTYGFRVVLLDLKEDEAKQCKVSVNTSNNKKHIRKVKCDPMHLKFNIYRHDRSHPLENNLTVNCSYYRVNSNGNRALMWFKDHVGSGSRCSVTVSGHNSNSGIMTITARNNSRNYNSTENPYYLGKVNINGSGEYNVVLQWQGKRAR